MTMESMIEASLSEIKEKLVLFFGEHEGASLTPELASLVTAELQSRSAQMCRAVFGAFLASKEETRDVIAVGGETFRFKQVATKSCLSVFGSLEVPRRLFQNASDTRSFAPMDRAWGMQEEYLTMEVREAVAFGCAHVTPEEAVAMLGKVLPQAPHATQVKRALASIAACIAPHREAVDRHIRAQEMVPEKTRALVASMDGVNVLLNEPGVKRGRPAERPTGEPSRETPTSYKNAMVGSISFYGEVAGDRRCPERLVSRYVSHMPEERAVSFKAKFEAELADVVAHHGRGEIAKVVLCDGARGIWTYIDGHACFDDFEKLVDYWHAAEHLSLAAEALFGKGSEEAARWYGKYRRKLKEADRGPQSVLDSMDYYAGIGKLSKARRDALQTQRTFFARNKGRMTYADFRRRGLPIGSGPVEAACKTLVKARMGRSGMRWSREGGQRILDFRTYVKSARWESFWAQYKQLAIPA